MTTLVALIFCLGALLVILMPVLRRRPVALAGAGQSLTEWQERYRGALADLQDAELDWQVGNLADDDYQTVRTEQRRRAAEALREATIREAILSEIHVEAMVADGNGVATVPTAEWHDLTAAPPASEAAPAARRPFPVGLAFFVGGGAAIAAVVGIGVLYFQLLNAQAAQQPLATLPIDHAHVVFLDGSELWVGHHGGLLRSSDGRAWRAAPVSGDVMALVDLGGRRLAFGHDVLRVSEDRGVTWAPIAHDLPGTDLHGAQLGSGAIYTYVVGFGVYRSADGSHWEQVSRPLADDVGALAVLPGQAGGDILFVNTGGVVARSTDGGRTWSGSNGAGNLALSGFVSTVSADRANGLLYAGTSQGLFRSSTGGSEWVSLPFRGAVTAVAADGPRIALVDDRGQFHLSTDGGGTWTGER